MYVISARCPSRVNVKGQWTVLYSGNGQPPPATPVAPQYLPSGFLSSLTDPLVIVVHGYNNLEVEAFSQYASVSGLGGSPDSLPAHGFGGSIVGYDWPSFGSHSLALWNQFGVYKHDLDAAREIAVPALCDFLDRLTSALVGRNIRINLLAHSMGNFVVSRVLMMNPSLASRLDNIISFAPDILQTDLERPEVVEAAAALAGCWFIYWAQADFILLTASDWANILLGSEQWGGWRLGQEGPRWKVDYGPKVRFQCWDVPLAKQMGSTYKWDIKEWPPSMKIHGLYWSNAPFLDDMVKNFSRPLGAPPVLQDWPMPPQP